MNKGWHKKAYDALRRKADGAGDFLFRTHAGRGMLAIMLFVMFFAGYATTSSFVPRCSAQWPLDADLMGDTYTASTMDTACPPCTPVTWPQPCDFTLQGYTVQLRVSTAFRADMQEAVAALERYIGDWLVDGMMVAFYEQIDQAETNLIDWWDTFWFYNMYPAMQDMTKQLSVSMAEEVRVMMAAADSQGGNAANKARARKEIEDIKNFQPHEGAAVAATLMGGQNRALTIGKGLRKAVQREMGDSGSGVVGTAGSVGPKGMTKQRTGQYESTFCDPDANDGENTCTGTPPPAYINADVQITRHLFNRLTIDIDAP